MLGEEQAWVLVGGWENIWKSVKFLGGDLLRVYGDKLAESSISAGYGT